MNTISFDGINFLDLLSAMQIFKSMKVKRKIPIADKSIKKFQQFNKKLNENAFEIIDISKQVNDPFVIAKFAFLRFLLDKVLLESPTKVYDLLKDEESFASFVNLMEQYNIYVSENEDMSQIRDGIYELSSEESVESNIGPIKKLSYFIDVKKICNLDFLIFLLNKWSVDGVDIDLDYAKALMQSKYFIQCVAEEFSKKNQQDFCSDIFMLIAGLSSKKRGKELADEWREVIKQGSAVSANDQAKRSVESKSEVYGGSYLQNVCLKLEKIYIDLGKISVNKSILSEDEFNPVKEDFLFLEKEFKTILKSLKYIKDSLEEFKKCEKTNLRSLEYVEIRKNFDALLNEEEINNLDKAINIIEVSLSAFNSVRPIRSLGLSENKLIDDDSGSTLYSIGYIIGLAKIFDVKTKKLLEKALSIYEFLQKEEVVKFMMVVMMENARMAKGETEQWWVIREQPVEVEHKAIPPPVDNVDSEQSNGVKQIKEGFRKTKVVEDNDISPVNDDEAQNDDVEQKNYSNDEGYKQGIAELESDKKTPDEKFQTILFGGDYSLIAHKIVEARDIDSLKAFDNKVADLNKAISWSFYLKNILTIKSKYGIGIFARRKYDGMTALHLSVADNRGKSVGVAAIAGEDNSNAKNCDRREMIQYLLSRRCNVFIKSSDNVTPLQLAITRKDDLFVNTVIDYFLDQSATGNSSKKTNNLNKVLENIISKDEGFAINILQLREDNKFFNEVDDRLLQKAKSPILKYHLRRLGVVNYYPRSSNFIQFMFDYNFNDLLLADYIGELDELIKLSDDKANKDDLQNVLPEAIDSVLGLIDFSLNSASKQSKDKTILSINRILNECSKDSVISSKISGILDRYNTHMVLNSNNNI